MILPLMYMALLIYRGAATMKARITYWNGSWWCRRMGCTGQGATMKEAWDDMWNLYFEAVRPARPQTFHSPRARCG